MTLALLQMKWHRQEVTLMLLLLSLIHCNASFIVPNQVNYPSLKKGILSSSKTLQIGTTFTCIHNNNYHCQNPYHTIKKYSYNKRNTWMFQGNSRFSDDISTNEIENELKSNHTLKSMVMVDAHDLLLQKENDIHLDVKEEEELKNQDRVPSINDIMKFAIPAIGVYLCSPLLSMIDTGTVGLFCGTLQQAALNPAVTVTDYSARTMTFLYTATTNIIATKQNLKSKSSISDKGDTKATSNTSRNQSIQDLLLDSLKLSFLVGAGLATLLLSVTKSILVPLVGNDDIDIEVIHAAWRYVAIRAIGMPAAAMIGTSQAACLGLKDNRTSFNIIVIAALMNLVFDVLLVGRKIAWVGGTAGAAWATTFSQYFAVYLFLRKFTTHSGHQICNEETRQSMIEEGMEINSNGAATIATTTTTTKKTRNSPTAGILYGKLKLKSFFRSLPSKQTMDEFRPFVIPVTTTQVGRCSTYIAMGHVVSSTMNTVSMAAQQIVTSIFYALIPIGESCSFTAQSFLPSIISQQRARDDSKSMNANAQHDQQGQFNAVHEAIKNISKYSIALGIFLSLIAASIPFVCPFLTTDPAVIIKVQQVVPIMLAILSTHGIFCASEGILLGFRDLKFLGRIYAMFFVCVPALMLRLKHIAIKSGANVNLYSIWNLFLGYQAFRITAFVSRVFILLRRESKRKQTEIQHVVAF